MHMLSVMVCAAFQMLEANADTWCFTFSFSYFTFLYYTEDSDFWERHLNSDFHFICSFLVSIPYQQVSKVCGLKVLQSFIEGNEWGWV